MNGGRPVSASTRLYAVLGRPVSHSLSPAMHNAAFRALGMDAVYLAFEVEPGHMARALDGAWALGLGGLNVTVPLKTEAFRLSAEKDGTALSTGAANTLVRSDGGWKAYNTDVEGFLGAVRSELGFSPEGRKAAVLGAGGAARAAVYGLQRDGADRVYIASRNFEAARTLASEILSGASGPEAVEIKDIPELLGPGDLLASATPLGLDPGASWPFPVERLDKGVLVYDMAYGKEATSLEAEAMKAGLKAAGGRTMLLLQGARAFYLWTGTEPPLDVMGRALGMRE